MNEQPQQTAIAATTTAEQQRVTAGQRRINRVWEFTQSAVSLVVIGSTAIGVLYRVFKGDASPLPAEWWTIVGLVIGFYFSRTNHTKVGGVQDER